VAKGFVPKPHPSPILVRLAERPVGGAPAKRTSRGRASGDLAPDLAHDVGLDPVAAVVYMVRTEPSSPRFLIHGQAFESARAARYYLERDVIGTSVWG
jgi:hypothetical protein